MTPPRVNRISTTTTPYPFPIGPTHGVPTRNRRSRDGPTGRRVVETPATLYHVPDSDRDRDRDGTGYRTPSKKKKGVVKNNSIRHVK